MQQRSSSQDVDRTASQTESLAATPPKRPQSAGFNAVLLLVECIAWVALIACRIRLPTHLRSRCLAACSHWKPVRQRCAQSLQPCFPEGASPRPLRDVHTVTLGCKLKRMLAGSQRCDQRERPQAASQPRPSPMQKSSAALAQVFDEAVREPSSASSNGHVTSAARDSERTSRPAPPHKQHVRPIGRAPASGTSGPAQQHLTTILQLQQAAVPLYT